LHRFATRLAHSSRLIHNKDLVIRFARARYISRSSGGGIVRSAAYNAYEAIGAERTGEGFYFRHGDAPEQLAVLLREHQDLWGVHAAVAWIASSPLSLANPAYSDDAARVFQP
jgi:hypothetical protein